jgi:hypothetical protein
MPRQRPAGDQSFLYRDSEEPWPAHPEAGSDVVEQDHGDGLPEGHVNGVTADPKTLKKTGATVKLTT